VIASNEDLAPGRPSIAWGVGLTLGDRARRSGRWKSRVNQLPGQLRGEGREGAEVMFHLDPTDRLLDRNEVQQWVLESGRGPV
jgi:hypothetical protein